MILTVTPNAAVDKTYRIENFALDRVNRPSQATTVAGGKGINVARVYQTLGGQAITTGFLGGENGRIVSRALDGEHIAQDFVQTGGETRVCIAVIDPLSGTQTEINETGPTVQAVQVSELLECARRHLSQTRFTFVVLSGSLPPGAPSSLYAELIEIARQHGVPAVLDSSGDALREGLRAGPWMVKPNQAELEAVLESALDDEIAVVQAAQSMQTAYHIDVVALTLGEKGAVLAAPGETWRAMPPYIDFASAVASGDSFVAAFLWAWEHGEQKGSASQALRLAVGAGAANAAVIGAGFCSREAVFTLAHRVALTAL